MSPDEKTIEHRFTYKSYPCVVKFTPMGWRCGYVGIPVFNDLYYMPDDYFKLKIDCHGGITYDGYSLPGVDISEQCRWIGFDCHHVGDGCDYTLAKERYGDDEDFAVYMNDIDILSERHSGTIFGPVRSKDYIINECKKIVYQLTGTKSKSLEDVYIVTRQINDEILNFVFRHKLHAEKCARRLKETYPNESISLMKYVIREDYK